MKVRNVDRKEEKIELQMTPMIDIVFQLLVFFLMTFNIVRHEGDFNLHMPVAASIGSSPVEVPVTTLKVRMLSNLEGELASLKFDGRLIDQPAAATGRDRFDVLRQSVLDMIGAPTGPDSHAAAFEVEFDCDHDLDYKYVIMGITAVSGKTEGDKVIKIVEKIKFAPPHKQE